MVLLRDFHRQLGGAPAPASTRTKGNQLGMVLLRDFH
jgi:hypothetical protein